MERGKMTRGRLRILLGAAPGVGKTYAMLDEGKALAAAGRDVVIALVETHGRPATAAMVAGLEVLPRRVVQHGGVTLTEMDVDAVLARRPQVALVDELAHTNAPGSNHDKRWQDVEDLLDAGIDVVSTVNIQHIESLNDVVRGITGVVQQETIPDAVLRAADQVEVIDLAPQALRDRLSAGDVYAAEQIDAALSNYFRLGNLTALREIALLWVAGEVDQALHAYRASHNINQTWEARERIVVALNGRSEGDLLLRRATRIAARAGGELIAVHVINQDGLRAGNPVALTTQRALTEQLGGSYHQVVGDDVARSLVDFAKSVDATQLVLGATRRPWILTSLTGPGVGSAVIHQSGAIDVHIVNLATSSRGVRLPRWTAALSWRRQLAAWIISALGGPLLIWGLIGTKTDQTVTLDVLAFQVFVIVVALVGGIWPALLAGLVSGVLLNYFFMPPERTLTIGQPSGLVALFLSVATAFLVSFVVDRAARRTRLTRRVAAESEVLAAVAGSVLRGQDAIQAILEQIREAFSLDGVRLVRGGTTLAQAVGPPSDSAPLEPMPSDSGLADLASAAGVEPSRPHATLAVGETAKLLITGADLAASERRLMSALIAQLEAALEVADLVEAASEVEPLAASERVRTALLAALGHDLRRPLAAAAVAVSGLKTMGDSLSEADRRELVETADESLGGLSALVSDLLDVSKLQAGVMTIALSSVEPTEVVLPALDELELGPDQVELDLPPDTPPASADPVLLQRVIVNLLLNAQRYNPAGTRVRVAASAFGGTVEIRVTDHGPGVAPERLDQIFVPFQRQGDTDNTTGLGLGLALSKGFVEAMGGVLTPEDTPGGGMTMVIALTTCPGAAGPDDSEAVTES